MLLELKNIKKVFEIPASDKNLTVLNGISIQVDVGQSIAIVGPSGSGKSTLLNILGTLDTPSSGSVLFSGRDLSQLNDEELAEIRNRDIGFIFQLHHLLPQCTVLENVLIPTIPLKIKKQYDEVVNRAESLLERVGLDTHLNYFPAQLSGGELQRVAVVRALINKPKLILADEPTGSLDRAASQQLGHLLLNLNREDNVTLIVVTHSIEIAKLMNKVYALQDGMLNELL